MLLAKPLIAIGELAFAIAGTREIEVVAIANGFTERKGFQLGIFEFGVFSGHFDLGSNWVTNLRIKTATSVYIVTDLRMETVISC